MVKRFQGHGGKVELESNEANGSTFTLILYKFANKPVKVKTEFNHKSNGMAYIENN